MFHIGLLGPTWATRIGRMLNMIHQGAARGRRLISAIALLYASSLLALALERVVF